ncbi:hypothetical protein L228DRAFT_250958 [Xylona heveae TC161]|uniref:Mitochondrial carrier protein pet8 n=1 Tax=Xylona heveae (strain CBS 132557 / TC161) TaxID=1328760 RepID=A0A164ZQ66_XYLHT|nr:hypothetical protein L228DRAFT_250958 [Xylona heveae TC161]KZF19367.1 hypothetical protein L228DRAFT_250958 [Xylona heveae TC161]
MAPLMLRRIAQTQALRLPTAVSVARPFSQTANVRALKESHTNQEGRGEQVEKSKQEGLKKQEEGKGYWHDDLASESESAVKADRGEIDATSEALKKLQKETEKIAHKADAGKSQ